MREDFSDGLLVLPVLCALGEGLESDPEKGSLVAGRRFPAQHSGPEKNSETVLRQSPQSAPDFDRAAGRRATTSRIRFLGFPESVWKDDAHQR